MNGSTASYESLIQTLQKLPFLSDFRSDQTVLCAVADEYCGVANERTKKRELQAAEQKLATLGLEQERIKSDKVRADQIRRSSKNRKATKRTDAQSKKEAELLRRIDARPPGQDAVDAQTIQEHDEVVVKLRQEHLKAFKSRNQCRDIASQTIERHFKKQSRLLHPDKNRGKDPIDVASTYELFQESTYCLRDSKLRRDYVEELLSVAPYVRNKSAWLMQHNHWVEKHLKPPDEPKVDPGERDKVLAIRGGIFHDTPRKPMIQSFDYKARRVTIVLRVTDPYQFYRFCEQIQVFASHASLDKDIVIRTFPTEKLQGLNGMQEITFQKTFPNDGIWEVYWINTLNQGDGTKVQSPRSQSATVNLVHPDYERLHRKQPEIIHAARQRISDIQRILSNIEQAWSKQHATPSVDKYQRLLHSALVKGRETLARLRKIVEKIRSDENIERVMIALQETLNGVSCSRGKTLLDKAIANGRKRTLLKNFKHAVAALLESGDAAAWIQGVNKKELKSMGGEPNRLYQLLVEGSSTCLEVDVQTLHNAAKRLDLFSPKQCKTLTSREEQATQRIEDEEKRFLAEAETQRKRQEQIERAKQEAVQRNLIETLLKIQEDEAEKARNEALKAQEALEQFECALDAAASIKKLLIPKMRVKIQDLKSDMGAQYNGTFGTVVRQVGGNGDRYVVQCDNGLLKSFQALNLTQTIQSSNTNMDEVGTCLPEDVGTPFNEGTMCEANSSSQTPALSSTNQPVLSSLPKEGQSAAGFESERDQASWEKAVCSTDVAGSTAGNPSTGSSATAPFFRRGAYEAPRPSHQKRVMCAVNTTLVPATPAEQATASAESEPFLVTGSDHAQPPAEPPGPTYEKHRKVLHAPTVTSDKKSLSTTNGVGSEQHQPTAVMSASSPTSRGPEKRKEQVSPFASGAVAASASGIGFECKFQVPKSLSGRIIGKHGVVVHRIVSKTKAHVRIIDEGNNSSSKKIPVVRVWGKKETEVHAAIEMIQGIAKECGLSVGPEPESCKIHNATQPPGNSWKTPLIKKQPQDKPNPLVSEDHAATVDTASITTLSDTLQEPDKPLPASASAATTTSNPALWSDTLRAPVDAIGGQDLWRGPTVAQPTPAPISNQNPETELSHTRPSSTNDALLMFLELHKDCIKGSPSEFRDWLSESQDIESLSDLNEAVKDEEYYHETLQPGNVTVRVKGFKAATFRIAALASGDDNATRHHVEPVLDNEQVPDELICPLTHVVMTNPVVAGDGYTYERSAIVDWYEKQTVQIELAWQRLAHEPYSIQDRAIVEQRVVSPMTHQTIDNLTLIENTAVRTMAQAVLSRQKS